jgi:hypothetical protein
MPVSSVIESPQAGRMPKPMTIEFNSGTCGSGKTYYICKLAASTPGRYVIAVDRREVVASRIATIEAFASQYGTSPLIKTLYSSHIETNTGASNVRRNVREAGADYGNLDHVIVFVTHEGLKSSDMSTYSQDWTLLIDEMLTIWTHGSLRSPALRVFLDSHYRLKKSLDFTGYATVVARSTSTVTSGDLFSDDILCDLAVFDRRVREGQVVANITDWDATSSRKAWSWWSVWSILELSAFSRIILVANAVEHSVTFKMMKTLYNADELILKPFAIDTQQADYEHRELTIRYFAAGHTAGTTFFQSDRGKRGLTSLLDWLSTNFGKKGDAYWSGNTALINANNIPNVTKLNPRAAGRNDLAAYTECAMIYTSKPSPDETTALRMCDVSRDDVVRTRETEDIFQMLMRSSLRDPSNNSAVTMYVYDQTQAMEQARLISESGLAISVTLEHVEVGLDMEGKPSAGRPVIELSDDEQTSKIAKIREQNRMRKSRERAAAKRISA